VSAEETSGCVAGSVLKVVDGMISCAGPVLPACPVCPSEGPILLAGFLWGWLAAILLGIYLQSRKL